MMVRAVALNVGNVAQRQQTGEVSRILLPVTITHSRKRLAVRISWHGSKIQIKVTSCLIVMFPF